MKAEGRRQEGRKAGRKGGRRKEEGERICLTPGFSLGRALPTAEFPGLQAGSIEVLP